MKVGELKRLLEDVADDVEVITLDAEDGCFGYSLITTAMLSQADTTSFKKPAPEEGELVDVFYIA